MNLDKKKLIKLLLTLTVITIGCASLAKLWGINSKTLSEYAEENPEIAYREPTEEATEAETSETETSETETSETETSETETSETEPSEPDASEEDAASATETLDILQASEEAVDNSANSPLIGTLLNQSVAEADRVTYQEGFYIEPLSNDLCRYITGVSYPQNIENPEITYDELRYVHILHYDFDGNLAEGELICNQLIAQDLVEIFHELYLNEYHLEKVRLIDAYDGDDTASMEDNNTSCFNYRLVEGSDSLSKHALGLAIDVNPLYNPYITYPEPGVEKVSPISAQPYADRDIAFPYKIDENDLCYKLFTSHGFTWGGNWNSCKDYQHFQKTF